VPEDTASARLIVGNRIRCPKDRLLRNMFAYKTFEVSPDFADELNVVLKCPCGHIFSPGNIGELRDRIRARGEEVVSAA